ncbi:MAG: enoyl-CoA hydratase [Chloroflexi bacterium]|nr:enoyl-CoA hydratase [Chloroflexota bacterium]
MPDLEFMLYEKQENVGVITLNRPERRNAQHEPFLRDLDQAYRLAEADNDVKVIVLKANGPHFSAGHDIGTPESNEYRKKHPIKRGVDGRYAWESQFYLGLTKRWRDIPKPTIAAVQGYCIAGGLMLCWPCDLIIAADNAKFSDPVVRMGIGGVEYFAHPWELGARKAKEMLFTGQFIDAQEAHRLGMVNRVVPTDKLVEETMKLAKEISQMPAFALAATKAAVNQTMDMMGQWNAMQAVFTLHQLAHANSEIETGSAIMGMSAEKMKKASGVAG